jgi:hypothetical protein
VVRHTGRGVRGTGVFEVISRGRLSEFAWTERLELPWPASGALGRMLAAAPARWVMRASLCRFRRLIRDRAPQAEGRSARTPVAHPGAEGQRAPR